MTGAADDPLWMPARQLAAEIAARRLSPVEVVEMTLEAIAQVNPAINAYVAVLADQALSDARRAEAGLMEGRPLGPLHGVPVAVKDTTDVAGVPTTMGSRLRRNTIATEDAIVVRRLREAGAIIIGKTNTPEFACKAITDNLLFGPTRNPWDTQRTPGGSSGGSAAALAAGLAPLATSNDAGGSVRIPSACCGLFGIKPQFGRVPGDPGFEHWETLSQEGAMARSVGDAALMLGVISGPHPSDRHSLLPQLPSLDAALKGDVTGLRIGYSPDLGYAIVDDEVRSACLHLLDELSAAGAVVEEVTLDLSEAEPIYLTILNAELATMVDGLGAAEEIAADLSPTLMARVEAGLKITAGDYIRATFARRRFCARLAEAMAAYDLLVTPMLGLPAWPVDAPGGYATSIGGRPVRGLNWSLAHPFNLTGQPAASVPAGFTEGGLPIGVQLIARPQDEATIFRVAAAVEQRLPWAHRRPPTGARTTRNS